MTICNVSNFSSGAAIRHRFRQLARSRMKQSMPAPCFELKSLHRCATTGAQGYAISRNRSNDVITETESAAAPKRVYHSLSAAKDHRLSRLKQRKLVLLVITTDTPLSRISSHPFCACISQKCIYIYIWTLL